MKRKEFLKKLKSKLYFAVRSSELEKILEDYEEYFSVGLANGKTGEALAQECGEPSLVAAEILSESKGVGSKKIKILTIGGILLLTFLLFYLFNGKFASTTQWYFYQSLIGKFCFLLVFPSILVLLLGGKKLFHQQKSSKQIWKLCSINGVVIGVITMVMYLLVLQPVQPLSQNQTTALGIYSLFGLNDPSKIGPFVSALCMLFVLVLLSLLFLAAIYTLLRNVFALPLLYVNLSAIFGLCYVTEMLSMLSEPSGITSMCLEAVQTMLLGFGLAWVVLLGVYFIERGGRHDRTNEKRGA